MSDAIPFARSNVEELAGVVDALVPAEIDALIDAIISADRVFITGVGRSLLSGKAVAMRLMHIGVDAFVVGEIATPAIRGGDLLLAFSATGRGSILSQAEAATKAGARVAAVTTTPDGGLSGEASVTLVLPVRSGVPTSQHAGSLFEQSSLVIGDAICRVIQGRLGVPTEELNARHANLA